MTLSIKRRHLSLATVAWCSGCALATQPTEAAPAPDADAVQAYRELRTLRGHFDGGTWNDELDRWQGRKHLAMQRLAGQMLQQRAPAAQLRRVMGEPDAVLAPGQADHARALAEAQWQSNTSGEPAAKTAALWLYRWRGKHDQLVVALKQDRVVATGWLYQGE